MSLFVDIKKSFLGFELDVQFEATGGVCALYGRSGSGKTNVIKAIAGLLRPDSGVVRLDEIVLTDTNNRQFVPVHKRRMGYVFQEGRLFPHLSVKSNLLYGAASERELDKTVAMLGLEGMMDRTPNALSGGEAQRVAIGRAFLSNPKVLLMDEPLAALDEARKADILPYLERLRSETGIPIVYVSHSMAEVARLANQIVILSEGKVLHQGNASDVLSDPLAVRHLGIREAGSVILARIKSHHPDGLTELSAACSSLFLPKISGQTGDEVQVRILAQDVILARKRPEGLSALNILPVTIKSIQSGDGPGAVVRLEADGTSLLARVTRRSAKDLELAPGIECFAVIKSVSVAQTNIGTHLAGAS